MSLNERDKKKQVLVKAGGGGLFGTTLDIPGIHNLNKTGAGNNYGQANIALQNTGTTGNNAPKIHHIVGTLPDAEKTPLQTEEKKTTGSGGGGSNQNPYTAQAQALYEQMMNRGDFRYDLQGDMLYRQAADQYAQLGQMAMRDTMGTAAGLTGGYGNSYANTVGNQAYQQYLSQLNAMLPQYYDRAYQAWQDQGADLMTRYQLALQKAQEAGRGGGSVRTDAQTESPGFWDKIQRAALLAAGLSNQQTANQADQIQFDNYFNEWWKKNKEDQEK